MWVWSLGWEDPLEEEMATHFSILAWNIPWTEEIGGPQSIGSQRVRHDWSNLSCMRTLQAKWGRVGFDSTNCYTTVRHVCVHVKSLQLCLTLCDHTDCSPPGTSAHRILQTRTLEWVAISFSRWSSQPKDQTHISCISCTDSQILYHCTTWKAHYKSRQCKHNNSKSIST